MWHPTGDPNDSRIYQCDDEINSARSIQPLENVYAMIRHICVISRLFDCFPAPPGMNNINMSNIGKQVYAGNLVAMF